MEAVHIKIHGIVQGVGFRPFMHRLVREHKLAGSIRNTSSGVELELEGERPALEAFLRELPERAPKLALIEQIEAEYDLPPRGLTGFTILRSHAEEKRNTLVSPDIGICEDCRRELLDPRDRRFRYPFINCTNCGPRFTIIRDLPYDRALTSMGRFPMCPDCDREYHDIENRRYHAQPDACPVCGPHVVFLDGEGREVPGDGVETAREWLKAGKILAVKGLGGVHLACRADDPDLVRELRRRKERDEKPFALMCRDTAAAEKLCFVSEEERAVLESFHKPIVLLEKRDKRPGPLSENNWLGVMLPYTPLHVLLFGDDIDALVMTSANLSDTPIVFQNEEALERLRGIADGFLLHDRDIQTRCDDSLCWVVNGKEYFARRSRGYVPFPVRLPGAESAILACGAEQKASFCLSRGDYLFPSQHIGDLKNAETLEHYEQQIAHFERLFDTKPRLLVCDRHPDYLSTAYARQRAAREGIPLIQVQHHHAHLAACMADNGLTGPVIGLIWDGVGYGDDGTAWGGECLIGDYKSYTRFGSILPIPLIGGDRAVKELDRVAFALLREAGCDTSGIPNAAFFEKMLAAGLNCPLSSGMGRLFDGAAAILGIKGLASYEGQGAVLLEAAAEPDEGRYPVLLEGEPLRFDWRELIRGLVRDRDAGVSTGRIAARFMNTLCDMAVETALAASRETGIRDLVLSGGSFQNQYLLRRLPQALEKAGLRPHLHRRVSCNDEGISLGQLMVGGASLDE
ncbi:MAG: carbamoyltransferase HypF [Oscillospiraceae bacterium]|nr:carbamoyltransferase HypF [Oscillospiraceae bacterium]